MVRNKKSSDEKPPTRVCLHSGAVGHQQPLLHLSDLHQHYYCLMLNTWFSKVESYLSEVMPTSIWNKCRHPGGTCFPAWCWQDGLRRSMAWNAFLASDKFTVVPLHMPEVFPSAPESFLIGPRPGLSLLPVFLLISGRKKPSCSSWSPNSTHQRPSKMDKAAAAVYRAALPTGLCTVGWQADESPPCHGETEIHSISRPDAHSPRLETETPYHQDS